MAIFETDQLYSSQGHKKTRSLFHEVCLPHEVPLATLGVHERENLFNLRQAFIAMCVDDPTEVLFAEAVFGDFAFWDNITQAKWMQPYLQEWRHICDVKRKQEAFTAMVHEVRSKGKSAVSAARFLIEEPWKKGRKAKTESKKSTDEAAETFGADVARMKDYL